jgi:hypothetical protein
MKTIFTSIFLAAGLTAAAQHKLPAKMHLGLVYPISSNGNHAPLDTNSLSINLIAGVSAAEQGLAFAGLSNVVRQDAKAMLFAGFSNHILGKADGAQFAGFANTYKQANGASFAGFANVGTREVAGAQFAGFTNTAGNLKGVQFAGFANVADTVDGAQFAGFANVAGKKMTKSQFAGFINVAQDIDDSQFAGFINIARKVKGAQFAGFINIADSSDFPVGIINIIKNGEKGIGATFDDSQTGMLSFRSGGKILYGIIGLGYNYRNVDEVYAFEAGIGAHLLHHKPFRLNIEAVTSTLESFEEGEFFKASLKAMPAIKIAPWLEIFGGPSFNYITTNTFEGMTHKDNYEHEWRNKWGSDFQAIYFGYQGGVQVIF